MSDADHKAVQKDWKNLVKPKQDCMSHELFLGYLVLHPHDAEHFSKFGFKDDLPSSPGFLQNAEDVFKFLGSVVDNLGGIANDLMKAKAHDHEAYRVRAVDFDRMFRFLPKFMGARGGNPTAWDAVCQEWRHAMFG